MLSPALIVTVPWFTAPTVKVSVCPAETMPLVVRSALPRTKVVPEVRAVESSARENASSSNWLRNFSSEPVPRLELVIAAESVRMKFNSDPS